MKVVYEMVTESTGRGLVIVDAKGALVVFKPKVRRTIEAMRRGLMFMTVVPA